MKNLKNIIALSLVFLLAACGEQERITYSGEFLSIDGPAALSVDEASGNQTVTIILSSAPSSDLTVNLSVVDGTALAGVDYSIPSASITIAAGEYTGTFDYTIIDNDEIDGSKSFTISLPEDSPIEIGNESSVAVTIVDNDFFCPRNVLANIVTTELDVGYSSAPVSISSVGAAGPECLEFRITGGSGTLFGGFANISYVVTLIEDSPESNSGTVDATEIFNLSNGDGSGTYNNLLRITGGTYDLTTGVLDVNYEYYGTDGVFRYPGTFRYSDGS
ncbi:MAG: Calx-beta domain-containing protein [Ekhidna sp.]